MGAEDIRVAWTGGAEGVGATRAGEGAEDFKEEEGAAGAATQALSLSTKTWAKCLLFYSSSKAAMTLSSL